MHISKENIESSRKTFASTTRKISLSVKIAMFCVVVVIACVSLVAPAALAGDSDTVSISKFGPIDSLGAKIYALEPLPTSVSAQELPYDEQALVITRDGQRHAREKEEKNTVDEFVGQSENAESPHEDDESYSENPIVEETSEQDVNYEATAKAAEQVWLEEQRRIAAEKNALNTTRARQEEASRLAAQQRAYDSEQEALRLQAQKAQQEEARRRAIEEANYLWSLQHPSKGQYRKAIAIAGEVVPWVYNRDICPDDTAGMWRGTGDVDDGAGSYVVGHNPGVFHMLIDSKVGVGDVISVWDVNGDARAYTIDNVFIIDEGTIYDAALRRRTTESGGESITLQTCIENGKRYKVFVAH